MKTKYLIFSGALLLSSWANAQNAIQENKTTPVFYEDFGLHRGSDQSQCDYMRRNLDTVQDVWLFQRYSEHSVGGQDQVSFVGDCSLLDFDRGNILLRASKGPYIDQYGSKQVTRQFGGNWLQTYPGVETHTDMDYGIYEARFKLPQAYTFVNGAKEYRNDGISFAMWLYGVDSSKNICHSEIDFFEMSGLENRFTHNLLYGSNDACTVFPDGTSLPKQRGLNKIGFLDIRDNIGVSPEEYAGFYAKDDGAFPDDSLGYTTITVEVSPQKVTWYMNGKTVQSSTGHHYLTTSLGNLPVMTFYIALSVGDAHDPHYRNTGTTWPSSKTVFPFEVAVDYFHYQKFRCSANEVRDESATGVPYSNREVSDYVYKYVALGPGQGGQARIDSTAHMSVRATEYIEFLPGFEITVGGEFYADVHDCDN